MEAFVVSVSVRAFMVIFVFDDKGNVEQTNQTSPVRAKRVYFTLVQHLSDCVSHQRLTSSASSV